MFDQKPALALVQRTIESIARILKHCQIDVEDAVDLLREAYSKTDTITGSNSYDPSFDPDHGKVLGTMLSQWHNRPEYTDQTGSPKRILLNGPAPSLRDLCTQAIVKHSLEKKSLSPERAAEMLVEHQSITQDGGWYTPISRAFRNAGASTSNANAQLSYVEEYLHTADHNMTHKHDPLFQRRTYARNFPARLVPSVRADVEEHAMALLELVDASLEQGQSASSASDEVDTVDISFGSYLYVKPTERTQ